MNNENETPDASPSPSSPPEEPFRVPAGVAPAFPAGAPTEAQMSVWVRETTRLYRVQRNIFLLVGVGMALLVGGVITLLLVILGVTSSTNHIVATVDSVASPEAQKRAAVAQQAIIEDLKTSFSCDTRQALQDALDKLAARGVFPPGVSVACLPGPPSGTTTTTR